MDPKTHTRKPANAFEDQGSGTKDEQFRLAIEAAPTGMLIVDSNGQIALVNSQIEKLFGYERAALVGQPVEMLVPERFRSQHPQYRAHFLARPAFRPMGAGRDLYGLHKNGSEIPIEIGLNPLRTAQGDFVLSSVVDITERKRAEREREELLGQLRALNAELEQRVQLRTEVLSATLREREVLLQEVHHRVKNNLYLIASLMEMQARLLDAGEARSALQDCEGRVHAIALIHEKLYQVRDFAEVPFATYMRGLASDVFQAIGTSPSLVTLTLAVEDVAIAMDKAVPCGLILNELLTNSLKHAFPGARRGTIRVGLSKAEGDNLRLAVSDDGIGLPRGFRIEDAKSLGLRLIATLTRQLDGSLEIKSEGGASFKLTFPVKG